MKRLLTLALIAASLVASPVYAKDATLKADQEQLKTLKDEMKALMSGKSFDAEAFSAKEKEIEAVRARIKEKRMENKALRAEHKEQHAASKAKNDVFKTEIDAQKKKLSEIVTAASFNEAEFRKASERIHELKGKIAKNKRDDRVAMLSKMTQEQRVKWHEMRYKKGKKTKD